ncbi:MAG: hypothetical protein ACI9KE_002408 [Polyangiales bacterium]|jgi:hypothetical protein
MKARPYFTYAGFTLLTLGVLMFSSAGAMFFFILAAVLVASFGMDWVRLANPPPALVLERALLGGSVIALVVFGSLGDWLNVAFGTLAVGALLSLAIWLLATRKRQTFEGTYLGQDGECALFERNAERWAFVGKIPQLNIGERYALRAKLNERSVEGEGPFRERTRLKGTVLEVGASVAELDDRRSKRALRHARDIAISCVTAVASLGFCN